MRINNKCSCTFLNFYYGTYLSVSDGSSEAEVTGGLIALCSVLKHGKREDLLQHAGPLLERILKSACKEHTNTAIRKFYLKLVQRLGLIFLKTRVAAWRYQRGSRSITINLSLEPLRLG